MTDGIVIKLKNEQQPPGEWRKVLSVGTVRHVRVDSYERLEGAVRLSMARLDEDWVLSTAVIQDIREPDCPGHPNNID